MAPNDAKKLFFKLGTCSQTFFHILNRDFGFPLDIEERAVDSLAGGILREGHQCGMLWGTALALGAESYRKCSNADEAVALAVTATQEIMSSFHKQTNSFSCREITDCNFKSPLSMAKYFVTGRFMGCYNLAQKWAPEAIRSANEGLSQDSGDPTESKSCASEVAKQMGARQEEAAMVAGFAGGLGLSGEACGALSAAIWLKTIEYLRKTKKKSVMTAPAAKKTLEAFYVVTGGEILCHKICGQHFDTISDHTAYLKKGGCADLLRTLANS